MFEYQKKNNYFAQIADEITDAGADELKWLKATNIRPSYRGIYFTADKGILYRINYQSRLFTRILAPVKSFDCNSTKVLYRTVKKIPWDLFFNLSQTFAIFANVSDSSITHSQYASLCMKDAIVDYFREKTGERPNVDSTQPDIWFNLHIRRDRAVISIDTSGGSLHKRGYRTKSVQAPMQETVAATIIRMAEWDCVTPLFDPMCGSGTILCEALMHVRNMPSGFLKNHFGFEMLPDFDHRLWNRIKFAADSQMISIPDGLISGSDIDRIAVKAAKTNCHSLDPETSVNLATQNFQNINELRDSVIITNPPYGIRLEKHEDLTDFYKSFGDFLKQKCKNSTAFIYFGDRTYIKKIGLKPSWKKPLRNGGLDGRLVKYELY